MGTLSYTATVSLDGYAADGSGDFQWTAPGEEVFDFHVERMGAVATEVLGRNTYELMTYWEAEPGSQAYEEWGDSEREFARRWRALDLVVASSTLQLDQLGSGDPRRVRRLSLEELESIVADAAGEVEIFGRPWRVRLFAPAWCRISDSSSCLGSWEAGCALFLTTRTWRSSSSSSGCLRTASSFSTTAL